MIQLSPAGPLAPALLDAPGGFAWWYADLLDAHGNGVVVIWAFGLPFLPGYQSAARRGIAPAARARPSIYVTVYREHVEELYLLQELGPDACSWQPGPDGDRWRFDASSIASTIHGDRRALRIDLDAPLPGGGRVHGRIELEGPARAGEGTTRGRSPHDWAPLLGPSHGGADLTIAGQPFSMRGRGYHDRNGSAVHLDGLGIEHWIWGRVPADDRELVYYLLWPKGGAPPRAIGLEIDAHGRTTHRDELRVTLRGRRLARFGMPYWKRVEIHDTQGRWLRLRHPHRLDDGPFYLRFATRAEHRGGTSLGSAELCRPGRVDLAPIRPFVRMKVSTLETPSRWLPLLAGPRRGRVQRLVREIAPRPSALLLPKVARG
ncbi:MAG: hypothetical protein IT378_02370 [Sandaracinaceae bacterium]|nr:hypothetical protein [Sandaracinaceae bacterium]